MPELKQLYAANREEWRSWLEANYAAEKEIWLLFYKKNSGKPVIDYEDAVEEAICFGWIDSLIKKLDSESYARKFTPRTPKAVWSESNIARAEKMIREGRMAEAGLRLIEAAKKIGSWERRPAASFDWSIPDEFQSTLDSNPMAKQNFEKMAPSHRRRYIGWIASAKQSETRARRSQEAVKNLEQNLPLSDK